MDIDTLLTLRNAVRDLTFGWTGSEKAQVAVSAIRDLVEEITSNRDIPLEVYEIESDAQFLDRVHSDI